MFISARALRLLAFGAPLWLLHALIPMGWVFPVTYIVVIFALVLLDLRNLPRRDDFSLEREMPERFALQVARPLKLRLENKAHQPVSVALRDSLPEHLEQAEPLEDFQIPGSGSAEVSYEVLPVRRGACVLGAVHCRIRTRIGLAVRQFTLDGRHEIKIYPRFLGVEQYELLAKIDEREEAVRKPRRVRGRGREFESLRAYEPGEDLRHVDWKASARRGSLISRNLQVERGQQLAVLIDAGRFMNEQIDQQPRFEHALNATVMLSYIAQQRGDAIAVSTFSNEIQSFVPPIKGKAVMPTVLESLYQVEPSKLESDYWHVVARIMDKLKRRSLIIMITDILDVPGSRGLMQNLIRAARKHLVLCVVFVEREIYRSADMIPANTDETYLKAAASHLTVERLTALEQMRARGILVLETTPDKLSLALIRRYLEIRQSDLL